jgi:hypothetical protein
MQLHLHSLGSLLAETDSFSFIYVLLPSSVSKAQKTCSLGLKPRVGFWVWNSCRNKQLWSWCQPSIMFTFQLTKTILIGSQTQGISSEFWTFYNLFPVLKHKQTKFAANWRIPSQATSIHTHIPTNNCSFKLLECNVICL